MPYLNDKKTIQTIIMRVSFPLKKWIVLVLFNSELVKKIVDKTMQQGLNLRKCHNFFNVRNSIYIRHVGLWREYRHKQKNQTFFSHISDYKCESIFFNSCSKEWNTLYFWGFIKKSKN